VGAYLERMPLFLGLARSDRETPMAQTRVLDAVLTRRKILRTAGNRIRLLAAGVLARRRAERLARRKGFNATPAGRMPASTAGQRPAATRTGSSCARRGPRLRPRARAVFRGTSEMFAARRHASFVPLPAWRRGVLFAA